MLEIEDRTIRSEWQAATIPPDLSASPRKQWWLRLRSNQCGRPTSICLPSTWRFGSWKKHLKFFKNFYNTPIYVPISHVCVSLSSEMEAICQYLLCMSYQVCVRVCDSHLFPENSDSTHVDPKFLVKLSPFHLFSCNLPFHQNWNLSAVAWRFGPCSYSALVQWSWNEKSILGQTTHETIPHDVTKLDTLPILMC